MMERGAIDSHKHHRPSTLSRAQRLTAYLAMLAFGLPAVLIALVGGEIWPFLDYRMYAEAKPSSEVDWLGLVGRTGHGEVVYLDDERYIVPFAPSELLRALEALDVHAAVDPAAARRALAGLLVAYEERRHGGEHDGPPLIALEVYRRRWTAQPGASNYARPDSRTLLQSVPLPETHP